MKADRDALQSLAHQSNYPHVMEVRRKWNSTYVSCHAMEKRSSSNETDRVNNSGKRGSDMRNRCRHLLDQWDTCVPGAVTRVEICEARSRASDRWCLP